MKALLTINKPLVDMNVVVRLSKESLKKYDYAVYIPDYSYIVNSNFDISLENVVSHVELN